MVVDKALTSENLGKVKNELSTILTTPSINGTQSNQRVTAEELNDFMKSLGVSDKFGITQDDFNTKLTQFFTKEGINVNDIGVIIEQLNRPNGVDSNEYFTKGMAEVQVVDTNYLDNLAAIFEKASTQATFSDLHSVKQGAMLVRDNLVENGTITKEIASETGLNAEIVVGTELTLLGTAVAVLAAFACCFFLPLNKLLHPSITFFAASVPRPTAKPVPSIVPPHASPSASSSTFFPVNLAVFLRVSCFQLVYLLVFSYHL